MLVAACSSRAPTPVDPAPPPAIPAAGLLAPAAFDSIAERPPRSQAMFVEITRVLTHARCVNCHPADDSPRQGDLHALHDPPVERGPANHGIVAMQCQTCHQDRNVVLARVPGARGWKLAPLSMAWLGKSPAQICAQLSDPERNGGRTLAQVHEHLGHDALVAWGWAPGAGRAPAPGSQAQLATLFQAWIDTGAVCPQENVK